MKKGRGLAREFMAAYHMTRTYIIYLTLQLRVSRAVTLFILHSFMASAGGQIYISLSFAKERFYIFNFRKFNKRFYVKSQPA
jgi:hypothetical protein